MDLSLIGIIGVTTVLPVGAVVWAFWRFRRDTAKIKNGIPADAVVESLAETGNTLSSPSVGPYAPVLRFDLLVTPPGGGAPYRTQTEYAVPRTYMPMVMPGRQIGVKIDPKNPLKVVPDWDRLNGSPVDATTAGDASGAPAPAAGRRAVNLSFDGAPGAGMSTAGSGTGPTLSFDANGNPSAGGIESLVGAVRSGAVPTIRGSFETIIATGTHGTAEITTAMPFGKTAGQVNPSVNPTRFNYPVWVFTVEVSLAGQAPYPAVFGHFVPPEKVGQLAPGVRLSVAVDPQNQYQDVAIDWERSPLPGLAS